MAIALELACVEIWSRFTQQVLRHGLKGESSKVKVIGKGHQIVESVLRLVLMSEHKKFNDDAVARFCSSLGNSKRQRSRKNDNHFDNNIDLNRYWGL